MMTQPTIESAFLDALKRGPVIVLDNMRDKTHAGTHDPIVDNSPLIRLAILAVDLGADPDLLCFNKHQRLAGMSERQCADVSAVMYNVGADSDDLTRALQYNVPTIGFHYCSLNAMYFVDEFGLFRKRLKAGRCNPNVEPPLVWLDPQPAKFDRSNPKHMRVLECVREHFSKLGWVTAAERLAACMEAAEATPVELGAGVTASVDAQSTMTITSTTAGENNQEQASELVIAEVDGSRSIRLRGRTFPFADSGTTEFVSRIDPGLTTFEGQWNARHLADEDSSPILIGYERGVQPVTLTSLCEAFVSMLRSARELKVTFGSQTRYGTLHRFETNNEREHRVGWRMQFLWSQDTAVAPESRPGAEKSDCMEAALDGDADTGASSPHTDVHLVDLVFFCRHAHQPIDVVRSWSPEKYAEHRAALLAVLKREGWKVRTPKLLTAQDDAEKHAATAQTHVTVDLRDTDPHSIVAAFNNETARRTAGAIRLALSRVDAPAKTSRVNDKTFEADLAALNRYLVDEHACTNPDGAPKVDPAAQIGVPNESGPAAAVRLLKLAAERGAFNGTLERCGELATAAWMRSAGNEARASRAFARIDVLMKERDELRTRAEKAETQLQILEMEDIGDALKRAKTAEDESHIWHERWKAHDAAISDISKVYFEVGFGPATASPAAVADALRSARSWRERAEKAEAELATMRTDFSVGDEVFLLSRTVKVTSLLDGRMDVEVELSPYGRREHVARTMLLKKPA